MINNFGQNLSSGANRCKGANQEAPMGVPQTPSDLLRDEIKDEIRYRVKQTSRTVKNRYELTLSDEVDQVRFSCPELV